VNAAIADFVFGYGSLARKPAVAPAPVPTTSPRLARLRGYRRTWSVAMDNAVDLPAYKHYRTPSGERPAVFVTFLNIVMSAHTVTNGVLFPVVAEQLDALDLRERNYERIEITDRLEQQQQPAGRAWAYVGTREALQRREQGRAENTAVVPRHYFETVVRDFGRLGTRALAEFTASTDLPDAPILELDRIDAPK
jgi:cation transport regulator ChaC